MKTLLLLAIAAIATPAASFADHCQARPLSFGGYAPFPRPYGHFAPPILTFSFASRPSYYSSPRQCDRRASSLEASVQRALRREGYYNGEVDGDLGPRSRCAIRDYQADHRMEITGRIDSRLLRSLGI